jgi:outer membrane protein OmpA-like peptidoglycan-associated protein
MARAGSFRLAIVACLALRLAGCAAVPPPPSPPGHVDTVVLLPDREGRTGVVVVEAAGVERRLSQPLEATRISFGEPPSPAFPMDEASVRALAGAAMDALPDAPVRFILHFTKGSAEMTPESERVFREALDAIKARGAVDISVVGHSDTLGDKAYNDRLSLKRALAVASRLEGEGVPPSVLEIASHGKENPLVPTGDQVAEPRNRRVEVTVR